MSSNLNREASSVSDGPGWLAPHRNAFLTKHSGLGYAAKTIDDCRRVIDGFCAQVQARDLGAAADIGVELSTTRDRKRYITRFIAHLIDAGVMAPPRHTAPPEPGSLDELSLAYGDWLLQQRGLSPKTISTRQSVLKRLFIFRFGTEPGDLNTITCDDIVAFLDSPNPTTGRVGRDYKATCLRSLFGFLFATARIGHDLAGSVPRVAKPLSGALVRHLEPDEIRRLVDAVHNHTGIGRRDHAILLLMARLGLRAQELIAIRLEGHRLAGRRDPGPWQGQTA